MTRNGYRRAVSSTLTLFALATVLPVSPAFAPALAADDKIRVAVVDFDTEALQSGWHYGWSYANLGRAAADNLASQLVKTGRYRVIERQQLDKVLGEQDLGDSKRVDPSTAARMGKVLGVQLVIVGSVTEFTVSDIGGSAPMLGKFKGWSGIGGKMITGKAALTARLVDTTTAEILGAFDGKGSSRFGAGEFGGVDFGQTFNDGMASKILSEAVQVLAKDIASGAGTLTPSTVRGGIEGKVAKVDGGRIYVNVGSDSGVKVGDKFEVRRIGEQIKDPDTGEVLGGDETAVGVVEIVKIIGAKLSEAKAVSGDGFVPGDRVSMK